MIGSRLGPYEVLSLLGVGGMGEVYRATDTHLKRQVPIKVLPSALAADPDRLARFQREAEVLAALNHPHIAAIYGLEKTSECTALVMELVDGDDLSERIARGPIPIDEALAIAKQIAEALEAAHEQGIIHRDLKPANIKVRDDGTVKVLDFGLAKAMEQAPGSGSKVPGSASISPTLTSPALMTGAGVVLGTAAYMAPEQAKGRAVDRRADIWAFGVVLFELLTGRRAFSGEDVTDTIVSLMSHDPDWSALPAGLPPAVTLVLRRCLQKDRKQRLGDMQSVRLALEGAFDAPVPAAGQAFAIPTRSFVRERLAWAALAGIALLGAGMAYLSRPAAVRPPEVRLQLDTPARGDGEGDFAVSPDGRMLVFRSNPQGTRVQLSLRRLDREESQPIAGTEGAGPFFWSPDSRSLAFHVGNELKRVDVADGRVQTITETPQTAGGSWGPDGTILFTRSWVGPLLRVPAGGGEVTQVTRLDSARQSGHARPQFLPDGRHFLFFAFGGPEGMGIYLGSLDAADSARLLVNDSAATFLPPDRIVFAREGALVAQRLDITGGRLVGELTTVAPHVLVDPVNALPFVSVSAAGIVAYQGRGAQLQLNWLDKSGRDAGTVAEPDPDVSSGIRASSVTPDWRTLALTRIAGGNADVWLTDLTRNTTRRMTTDRANDTNPRLSPDASQLVFASDRKGGVLNLYTADAQGGTETPLLETSQDKLATDWSRDGQHILYQTQSGRTGNDLWALPLSGDRKPFPVVESPGQDVAGQFSPDGRWIAYSSDLSGRTEVYTQSFPASSQRLQVSTAGGRSPQWSSDGHVLFYLTADNRLMQVALTPARASFDAGPPELLFTVPAGSSLVRTDGQRSLFFTTAQQASPITLLLNWSGAAAQ